MMTHIELLAAIISGSPRRPITILVSQLYPAIADDNLNVTTSFKSVIDGSGHYIDPLNSKFTGFTFEIVDIIITQNQKPEYLNTSMTTKSGTVIVDTINLVTQNQKADYLTTNMNTSAGLAVVINTNPVTQNQKDEYMNVNMTTKSGSTTIIN